MDEQAVSTGRVEGSSPSAGASPLNGHADTGTTEAIETSTITGSIDAIDLLGKTLAPLRMVVPDILPEGTTILAAPPKIGKSALAYQMAVEVALGGTLLGRPVNENKPGDVLYLALEDGERRGQSRLKAALNGRERQLRRGRLTVQWDCPPLGGGLEEMLTEWLDRHADAALVIIDTLGKVRGEKQGDERRNAYQVDVRDLREIARLIIDRGVCLLIIHHTRKPTAGGGDDFVSAVSGTYGLAGSADTVLVIKRKRHEAIGSIDVTSREMAEAEIAVRFEDMRWDIAPDALPGASAERQAIYDVIRDQGPIMPVAVSRILRKDRTSVQHTLKEMTNDGLIARIAGGYVAAEHIDGVIGSGTGALVEKERRVH